VSNGEEKLSNIEMLHGQLNSLMFMAVWLVKAIHYPAVFVCLSNYFISLACYHYTLNEDFQQSYVDWDSDFDRSNAKVSSAWVKGHQTVDTLTLRKVVDTRQINAEPQLTAG